MSDFANNLIETMAMIADNAVTKASFDKTIQVTIMSCQDEAMGIYKVKYQDSIWFAHSNNLNTTYSAGTSVYVLVPGNDIDRNKTILGTVSGLGKDYIDYINNEDNFIDNGNNLILQTVSQQQLCSYKTEEKILYDASYQFQQNILDIDSAAAAEYLHSSEYMLLQADFRTNLPSEQRKAGNYGINVTLCFQNQDNPQNLIERTYTLDIDDMEGNPYAFKDPQTQKAYFPIDGDHFLYIDKISIFDKNFANSADDKPNDIFVSNFVLQGKNTLSIEQQQGLSLRIKRSQGYIFTSNDTNDSSRDVTAQVRVNGRILSPSLNKINFYWFKQNSNIDAGSDHYLKYGGKGWYCLNEINDSQEESNIKFLPAGDTLTIFKSQIPIEEVRFKCVAVYNGTQISSVFKMINKDAIYSIEIVEVDNKQLSFFSNEDSLKLKCIVKQNGVQVTENLEYNWKMVTQTGSTYIINPSQDQQTGEIDYSVVNISATGVRNYNDYYCSVNYGSYFIGMTSSVRIFKRTEETNRYILSINNGSQIFNYDESGNSPANKLLDNPITIPELTFQIIDTETGQDVSNLAESFTWIFPLKNTLLIDKNDPDVEKEISEDQSEAYFYNLRNFVYGINDRYAINQMNNTIKLQIGIHNVIVTAETNFLFTKEGESGTNGTDLLCKISGYKNGQRIIGWLISTIEKASDSGMSTPVFNWDGNLIPQLWRYGEEDPLNLSSAKITWQILSNKDNSWYSISSSNISGHQNEGVLSLAKDLRESDFNILSGSQYQTGYPANIIKLTIQYEGRKYYDTVPIVTVYNSNYPTAEVSFPEKQGFKYVIYSQDGQNPKFDDSIPFEIVTNRSNLTWSIVGSVYKRMERISSNNVLYYSSNINLIEDVYRNQNEFENDDSKKYFKPLSKYDGQCVTSGIIISGTNVKVHIPIHFMLNRYGHKNLNDWDGNSINISDEEGFILSPQIGAGYKNDNNQFTGLLMGTLNSLKESSQNIFSKTIETGLFGYSAGERTIFLDANTGKAEFGKQGAGRITIDPTNNKAEIRSGNYVEKTSTIAGSGMLIDFSTPLIKFGSGNFSVDSAGNLTAKTGKIGPWYMTDSCLYYNNGNSKTNPELGTSSSDSSYIYLGTQGFSLGQNFIYDNTTGNLILKVNSLSIGGVDTANRIAQVENTANNAAEAARNATSAARNAAEAANEAKKTATNYLYFKPTGDESDVGLYISKTAFTDANFNNRTAMNLRITDDNMSIYKGKNKIVQYGVKTIFYSKKTVDGIQTIEEATTLDSSGLIIKKGIIQLGSLTKTGTPDLNTQGFYVNANGDFTVGNNSNYITWVNNSLTIKADITATNLTLTQDAVIQGKIFASSGSMIGEMKAERGNGQPNFHSGNRVNYNDSGNTGVCIQTNGNFGISGVLLSQRDLNDGPCCVFSWEDSVYRSPDGTINTNMCRLLIGEGQSFSNITQHIIMYANGYCTAVEWKSTSDEKLKNIYNNNQINFNYKKFFMSLNPIIYTWKEEEKNNLKRYNIGFGAQSIQKILNDLQYNNFSFIGNDDGTLSLSYKQLFMTAVPVIQQHQQQIILLKQQIKQLKQKIKEK